MLHNIKDQFFLDSSITFLNHGSFGACAKPIYKDLLRWQQKLEKDPVQFFEEEMLIQLKKSRDALGNFIGCKGDDLVFFQNSESYPVDTSLIFSFFLFIKLRIPEIIPLS